jgi:hypothetical protein
LGDNEKIVPELVKTGEREWTVDWAESKVVLMITDRNKPEVRIVRKGVMVTTWPSVGFSIQKPR